MNHDEVRLSQSWIVEGGFQQQRIASALTIEPGGALEAVNVHGQAQRSRFTREVIEKKILERLVAAGRWFTAFEESPICRARLRFVRIVKVQLAQIRSFKLNCHHSILLLSLERRCNDLLEILIECCRQNVNS